MIPRNYPWLGKFNAWLRRRFLGALLVVISLALLLPQASATLKGWSLFEVPILRTRYDFPTLALTLLMLSASVNCRLADFRNVLSRRRAMVVWFTLHYLAMPTVALVFSAIATGLFHSEAAHQIRIGIIFIALMPVALTAAAWVRVNMGSLPLLVALIVFSTGIAVVSVPLYVLVMPGMSGQSVDVPIGELVQQLVLSVSLPLVLGMVIRSLWSNFVDRWQYGFELIGSIAMFASVFSNVGTAAPKLAAEGSLLIAATVVTIAVTIAGFWLGVASARWLNLPQDQGVALVFGSGMRTPAVAMVLGAATFPTMPLVPIPAALYSIVQQLIAGYMTRALDAFDSTLLGSPIGIGVHDVRRFIDDATERNGRRTPHLRLVNFSAPGSARAATTQELMCVRRCLRGQDFVSRSDAGFSVVLRRTSDAGLSVVVGRILGALPANHSYQIVSATVLSSHEDINLISAVQRG